MKSIYGLIVILLAALIMFVGGCAKRSNPAVPDAPPAGWVFEADHQYAGLSDSVAFSGGFLSRRVMIYTPAGYGDQMVGDRFPVLYLLPGYDGEPSFYYQYGNELYSMASSVQQVADKLIADGEIKPMIIVMPDASIPYGGSFFANSSLIGKWEDMMARELVTYVDSPNKSGLRTWLTRSLVRYRDIPPAVMALSESQ